MKSSQVNYVTFTLKVSISGVIIPQKNEIKYLGMHVDRWPTWRKHIETKALQMYWIQNDNSKLGLEYDLRNSALRFILHLPAQSRILRIASGPPWFVNVNVNMHRDVKTATVTEAIPFQIRSYKGSLKCSIKIPRLIFNFNSRQIQQSKYAPQK